MLYIPVAPVMGTAPLKFTPPLKYDHVNVIALNPTGVMTYARGDRSCAQTGKAANATRPASKNWRINLTANRGSTASRT